MNKQYYVYIMTNYKKNTLYIGMTNNLKRRVYEHKKKSIKGFTEKYNLVNLVYYEIFIDPENAIIREKQLKNWHKEWKLNLIKENNPKMLDLTDEINN